MADLALAALLLIVVVFTGVALGSQLPKITSASRTAPAATEGIRQAAGCVETVRPTLAGVPRSDR